MAGNETNLKSVEDDLEETSIEISKLREKEEGLIEQKNDLLKKEIIDGKVFNRCKWEVIYRDSCRGFMLQPIDNDRNDGSYLFDDLQDKLDLYPHGYFQFTSNIEIIGSDGDLYISSNDIKAGIEFIKSYNIDMVISESILNRIKTVEKEILDLREFVDQFYPSENGEVFLLLSNTNTLKQMTFVIEGGNLKKAKIQYILEMLCKELPTLSYLVKTRE